MSVTVVSAAAAATMTAGPVLADPAAPPVPSVPDAPPGGGVAAAGDEVDRLFAAAERAVERYNGTAERVADLEAEVDRRQERVARGQQAVNEQRRTLGTAAAAQYRAGGIDPFVALLLSTHPEGYLSRAATLDRISERQSGTLRELLAAQRTLERRREETEDALAELSDEQARMARDRRTAQHRLAAAELRYERLSARERERRERAAREAVPEQQPPVPAPVPAAATAAPPSDRAATAAAAAQSAVGKPYAWGQAGPGAFDCSGLVQWSYAQAGVALPRTSQQQATAGQAVPLDQARPGDIVVYRSDASHVGIYVGGGQIVHAPHPGAVVRHDPVGMMPVASVVRP